MKNDKFNGDRQFEEMLKNKMKEISSNVDVFDKISERAFPEKDSDFSDSEFTVSDLENVTGKHLVSPFFKWVALAAVLVICVVTLPFSSFGQQFFTDMSRRYDPAYNELVAEFISETANGSEYIIYDVSLKDYAQKDVLVTPLYRCPFEYRGGEAVRVRIFTKVIGNRLTNQMYAVEYTDEFKASNFIAIAESKAKFKEDEVPETEEPSFDVGNAGLSEAVNLFFVRDEFFTVHDKGGNNAMVASFTENKLFKLDNNMLDLSVNTLYARKSKDKDEMYTYDILALDITDKGAERYNFSDKTELWARSINVDGSSAFPEKRATLFEKNGYFSFWAVNSSQFKKDDYFSYFMPFEKSKGKMADRGIFSVDISSDQYLSSDKEIGTIDVPLSDEGKASMRIYIGNFLALSSFSDPTINVKASDNNENIIMRSNDVKWMAGTAEEGNDTEDQATQQKNEQEENEASLERRQSEIEQTTVNPTW